MIQNSKGNAAIKVIVLILGIALLGFGAVIIMGTAIKLNEGTSNYDLSTDLLGLFFAGILPVGLGAWAFKWAVSSRPSHQANPTQHVISQPTQADPNKPKAYYE